MLPVLPLSGIHPTHTHTHKQVYSTGQSYEPHASHNKKIYAWRLLNLQNTVVNYPQS